MKIVTVTLIIGCLILANPLTASSAELEISTDKVFLLEKMYMDVIGTQKIGYIELFSIPDHFFLAIPMRYEIIWDDQTQKMKIPADEFILTNNKGEKVPLLGEMRYHAALKPYFNGISDSRPRKWKDSKYRKRKKLYPVFVVSNKGASYTLTLGGKEVKITSPEKISEIGPEAIASYKVTHVKRVKELPAKRNIYKKKYKTMIYPMTDTFLAVTIKMEPKPPTRFEKDHFFWHTTWFGLKDEWGAFVPTAGEYSSDMLYTSISHNALKGQSGLKVKDATLYFAVSSKAKKFQLYCFGKPVAEISVP
jgi:hypothetical protein